MPYTQTYDRLHVTGLNEEQHAKTCGYWYTVTSKSTPHTAFRTRAALLRWLEDMGLSVDREIPTEGESWYAPIFGSFRVALHMDLAELYATEGFTRRDVQNGEYTLAIVSSDEDGLRTLHQPNPNCRTRPVYDYRTSQIAVDAGSPHGPNRPNPMSRAWRYEASSQTIRSVPENYWIASLDSWDGAVNHALNAYAIERVPQMIAALKAAALVVDADSPELALIRDALGEL